MDKNTRLYAQIQPDEAGIMHLLHVQKNMPTQIRGHAVSRQQLHLTLIHFGNIFDIYSDIKQYADISYETYGNYVASYLAQSQALLQGYSCQLVPLHFSAFGPTGRTLVIEYEATAELAQLHQQLLNELREFLRMCGIANTDSFITNNKNLAHSATLRPHVALYKGYQGELPTTDLKLVAFTAMDLVF